eukprot:Seg1928.3 transcript_id=Seg1928.3/GoldUCD/mRNA.D3Y31 product="Synaptojanin-2-binding protein" protein_id=Seg1928.3/GoldUCD/D3Y31
MSSSDEEQACQRQDSLFDVERVSDVDKSDIEKFWNENQICVELTKAADGFGLTLEGGVDRPLYTRDTGIFITNIRKDSNADRVNCLEVGDKILEVDGHSLEDLNHTEAINYFKTSNGVVRLVVHKNIGILLEAVSASTSPSGMDSSTDQPKDLKGFSPVGFVVGTLVGCIVVFAIRRYWLRR